jgi:hypothetical protein
MTDQFLPFGSWAYFMFFALLLFSRGMDLLSTRIATPNMVLEGNPLARRMGWRGGIIFSFSFSAVVAFWPLPAIMISVMSLLVAARNFQSAWMMRSMGEADYSNFIHERLKTTPPALFVWCIVGQTVLTGMVGLALMLLTGERSIPFAIGAGICTYAFAVLYFSLLSIWRIRRA